MIREFHGLHIEVQTVSHPSRVHLDIETNDVEAEVRRLEKLGLRMASSVVLLPIDNTFDIAQQNLIKKR